MARDLPDYDLFPQSIIDDVGATFSFGATCGAAFHFVRGVLRGSPGSGGRLVSGVRAALANAPRVAGKFTSYFFVISAIEYPLLRAQGVKEGYIPVAAASLAVSGWVGMRRGGVPVAARYVLFTATSMAMAAEFVRFVDIGRDARCLRRNHMNGRQLPIGVLRREDPRPLWTRMSPF